MEPLKELSAHELFGQTDKYQKFKRIKYATDDNFYDIDDIDILPVYGGDRLASNFTRLGLNLILKNIDEFTDQMLISYLTDGKLFAFKIYLQRVLRNTGKVFRARSHIAKKREIENFIHTLINSYSLNS